jgi:hypothetical protein
MNVNRFSNLITNLSLIGILVVLVLIWKRMPPTNAELRAAKTPDERKAIHLRQPSVTVDARDTLDVNVQGGAVQVLNASFPGMEAEPIEVKIVR